MNSHNSDEQDQGVGRRAFLTATTALGVAALAANAASARPRTSAAPATFASLDDWIAHDSIPFAFDKGFDAAVDKMMARLGDQVMVLGFGEALHGGEEFLVLRNRLFQRLVEAHGYSAITVETNDMRARLVDDYVGGRGPTSYAAVKDKGFSVGIGDWDSNRELVEWMRRYNSDPARKVKLNLYGTLASDQETTESPRRTLEFAIAYLGSVDPAAAAKHQAVIAPLLGADAEWTDSAAAIAKEITARLIAGDKNVLPGAGQEIGVSPRAQALRTATEELSLELTMRRPELVAKTDRDAFGEAMRHVTVAKNLLAVHAAMARRESLDTLVSMRDVMAAEHLAYIVEREKPRGRVLVFLHEAHLRRSRTKLPWYEFLPTGAHLDLLLGERFAVVAGALGTSEASAIGAPEAGSIEARLLARKTDCFIPTHRGKGLHEGAAPSVRSRSSRPDVTYEPLTSLSVGEADMIAFVETATRIRGWQY